MYNLGIIKKKLILSLGIYNTRLVTIYNIPLHNITILLNNYY